MIVMGRIVSPYGVKGWVKIQPFGDDPATWRQMPTWWLSQRDDADDAAWQPFGLQQCRPHGRGLIANLEGITDRAEAEALNGFWLGAPRDALPPVRDDEYYWADLIGLDVINEGGEALGRVDSLISTGAHDVLQVRDGDTERLIPFTPGYVPEVDLNARRLVVAWERDW